MMASRGQRRIQIHQRRAFIKSATALLRLAPPFAHEITHSAFVSAGLSFEETDIFNLFLFILRLLACHSHIRSKREPGPN